MMMQHTISAVEGAGVRVNGMGASPLGGVTARWRR